MSENVRFRLAGGQNPLILVPAYVEKRGPYEFILDTGASHCLISQELSATLGIRPEAEKDAMGAGGAVKLSLARVSSIMIGSVRQENVQVGITNELQRIGVALQSRVDGDLGFDFLKDFVLVIDYTDQILRLAPPPADGNWGGARSGTSIPFKLAAASKPLILVPAVVNGEGPFQFALDTGASRTTVSTQLTRTLAIQTSDDSPVTGGGGQVKILAGKLTSLAVGNAAVCDHAIGTGEFLQMLSTVTGIELDGILGYNFLSQFRVTINYPRSILELVPACT